MKDLIEMLKDEKSEFSFDDQRRFRMYIMSLETFEDRKACKEVLQAYEERLRISGESNPKQSAYDRLTVWGSGAQVWIDTLEAYRVNHELNPKCRFSYD